MTTQLKTPDQADLENTSNLESSDLKLSRRSFVVGTASAVGGGLSVGFHVPALAQTAQAAATQEVNAWVVIRPDDSCVIRVVRAEMGQGTHTGLAQLVAEELECDWARVSVQQMTAGQNLARNRVWKNMATGGSRGIRESHEYVRQGGAAAKIVLLQAAANQFGVPVAELSVSKGVISHAQSGRQLSYGQLADQAAKLPAPDVKTIKLKSPKDWKLAGQPLKRLDTAMKVNGRLKYAVDIKLPGMVYAAIKACPVFEGKLKSFDDSAVKSMRGIKAVLRVDDNAVAVVADNWWRAKQALNALPIVWDEGVHAKASSETIRSNIVEGLTSSNNVFAETNIGDVDNAIAKAHKRIDATYITPFVSHACMEPMNCTALITENKAEVWVASQNAEASLAELAKSTGLDVSKCEVYNSSLGTGFGRRGGFQDYVKQAALLGKQMLGTPVKLLWSREEDITHDFYRPIGHCKMSAGLDNQGNLVGLSIRVSGQSINAFAAPHNIKDGKDRRQLQGLWPEPDDAQFGYTIPNFKVEYAMRNSHVPVGPWRGVNTNQNGLYSECFMEEVVHASGKDALEFRRALLKDHPKHLGVLNAVAEKAGWGKPTAAGRHRGIAQFMGYGSYTAAVAEISIKGNEIKIHELVLATNCGHAVNQRMVAAQVEGSVAYALDTLQSEVTIKDGRVEQSNFDTYPIARLKQMPHIETVIAPTFDFWGGVGEPTICVVAPAILNAIYKARGTPIRNLPLKNSGLKIV
jgi:isoquinoline 1-oxidoreductase beta subunit